MDDLRTSDSAAAAGLAVTARMPPPWGQLWWTKVFFPLYMTMASQAENMRHDTAWIVVRNRRGDERILFWVPVTDAKEKSQRVQQELHRTPLKEWCGRYGVPLDFADPPPAGVL